jgi:hypothetical protein
MEVRHKSHLQIGGFKCRDAPVEKSGLGATHNAGSEIDKIGAIANNNGAGRARTVRIGDGRAGAKQYDPCLWWARFLFLSDGFLGIDYCPPE